MRRANPHHHEDQGTEPAAQVDPLEIAQVRRVYGLRPDADPMPWVEYARARSVWRQRAGDWLMDFLASPDRHLSRVKARRIDIEADHQEARQQILDRFPNCLPVEVANLICDHHRMLMLEIAMAGWIPKPPPSPATQTKPRDPANDDARWAKANALAEIL